MLGTQRVDTPLFGGTLVPNGDIAALVLVTDAVGVARFDVLWPRLPSGFACYGQAWCWDPSMPASVAATNGVILRQP